MCFLFRTGVQTFRREHDRFWVAAAHPTLNLFAAGMLMELQSSQVKHTPQDSIKEFIVRNLNPLVVVDFIFISAFLLA